jgi:hypothetical protein
MFPRMPEAAANLGRPCPACGWFRLTRHALSGTGAAGSWGSWFVRCDERGRRFHEGAGGALVLEAEPIATDRDDGGAAPAQAAEPGGTPDTGRSG